MTLAGGWWGSVVTLFNGVLVPLGQLAVGGRPWRLRQVRKELNPDPI